MAKTIKTITMTQPEAYLKVIIGPMWSGKSTEVINIYKYNQIAQIPTLVVNFAEDKRYHETKLSTHDKMMINNLICETLHPDNITAKISTMKDEQKKNHTIRELNKFIKENNVPEYKKLYNSLSLTTVC